MSEQDVEMAREAGFDEFYSFDSLPLRLNRFADIIRADERKACATLDFRKEIGLTSDQDYKVSQLIVRRGNK